MPGPPKSGEAKRGDKAMIEAQQNPTSPNVQGAWTRANG